MDTAFITGMSAFVSSMIVFVGSAFLLLALILGPKLSYFITASITLAFTLIMGVVWSINPLGPLGRSPEWVPIDAQPDASALEFDAAGDYPDEPWQPPNTDDALQATQASELESGATKYLTTLITSGKIQDFPSTAQYAVAADTTRLLTRGEEIFGITTINVLPPLVPPELGIPTKKEREAAEKEEDTGAEEVEPLGQVSVVAEYDPGDPLGVARQITIGTFILFVLHLFGLSRAESRLKRERVEEAPA